MCFLSAIALTQHIAFLWKSSCLKEIGTIKKQRAVANPHAKNHPKPYLHNRGYNSSHTTHAEKNQSCSYNRYYVKCPQSPRSPPNQTTNFGTKKEHPNPRYCQRTTKTELLLRKPTHRICTKKASQKDVKRKSLPYFFARFFAQLVPPILA
jgi:hypothetical protein